MNLARTLLVGLLALLFVALPRTARAAPPAVDLMARLAVHAQNLETMRTHASCTMEGRLDGVDGNGKTDSIKEGKARVEADGQKVELTILKYVEDGEDKTAEAQKKSREKKDPKKKKKDVRMPFHSGEQARYVFDQVEIDKADPSRVRISFTPNVREEDTIEGSAWVDTKSGTVTSADFKLAKTPMFVDYMLFTVEFGAQTSLGPAISKVTVEGKGGLLFITKRFRGVATVSEYKIVP